MSGRITGYTETTPQSLTTGAAVIYKNFDPASDTVASAKAKIISATSGGVTVTVEYPDAWDREIDGLPANSVGMREQEFIKPTVKATLAEVSNADVLAAALGAATVTSATSPTGYNKIVPKNDVADSDYLENITAITQTKGTNEPLIIVIENPLSTEGFEFATESKAGGGIEVTWTGNYDPLNLDDLPIKFYVPAPASTSTP